MRQVWEVLRKDLLIEWRGRSRSTGVFFFAMILLLLFSFALGPDSQVLRQHAGAYMWLSLLLSSTLALSQSFRIEVESDALTVLRLLPVSPVSLYYGKAAANTLVLLLLGVASGPIVIAVFDVTLHAPIGHLLLLLLLGCAGLAAPGTLYAGITCRAKGQEILLPVLLFPLIVPAMLASVKATTLMMNGDPMGQGRSWFILLLCFDIIYWSISGLLFAKVIEE
ncbi:MAG: heme exporter protein CcmB [Candidatus Schekmanbacteria bacterium]|nr:heme exporter protein CcmB [Candidatus Schekmanbacteria bacterium]